jgi:hypothetical protein
VTRRSVAATEAAQRLWARESAGAGDTASAVTRICGGLDHGLSRWIGAEGYRALLRRALEEERTVQSPFATLQWDGNDGDRIAAAVKQHGAHETVAWLVSLVASLIDLLGRVVGEDMAVQLIEQGGSTRRSERAAETEERGR